MAATILDKGVRSEILERSRNRTRGGERFCMVYLEEVQRVAKERGIDPQEAVMELYRHTFRKK